MSRWGQLGVWVFRVVTEDYDDISALWVLVDSVSAEIDPVQSNVEMKVNVPLDKRLKNKLLSLGFLSQSSAVVFLCAN